MTRTTTPQNVRDALIDIGNASNDARDILMVLVRALDGSNDSAERQEVAAFAHVASLAQMKIGDAIRHIDVAAAALEAINA